MSTEPTNNKNPFHYFDYAATAPLCKEAAHVLRSYMPQEHEEYKLTGNANSLYDVGRASALKLEDARNRIAKCIDARRPDEVVFTSGATESNNAAILGIARGALQHRINSGKAPSQPHIIISALEHASVLKPAETLKREGWQISYLTPNRQGFVSAEQLKCQLTPDVLLCSCMLANSEIGSIQPIAELADVTHKSNVLFHADVVQALGKIPVSMQDLAVDAASFSCHKIGGPLGVGALYLRSRTPFSPLIYGGGQEQKKRSGTQNLPCVCAFATVAERAVANQASERKRLSSMRDYLCNKLSILPGLELSVDPRGSENYLPHLVHVLAAKYDSETLVQRLDYYGFAVSGGSACSSGSSRYSHVLAALSIPEIKSRGALRFSFGRYTTTDELDLLLAAVERSLK